MPKGIFYDRQSGVITSTMEGALTQLLANQTQDIGVFIHEGYAVYTSATHHMVGGYPQKRPEIQVTLAGQGLLFDAPIPAGLTAKVKGRFHDVEVLCDGDALFLDLPDAAEINFVPPWPYKASTIFLTGEEFQAPDGAQIVECDLDLVKGYYNKALYARAEELRLSVLGNPDEATQSRWLLKRSLFDKHERNALSEADLAALSEEVRYSGVTVEEHLALIGNKVAFENWVTFRTDGIRDETQKRIDAATTAAEVLAAIEWGEVESAAAVEEAGKGKE